MPFDFFDELIFENARVLIRPLKENDSELVESFTKSEPDLWQFSLTSPVGENSLKAYISNALKLRTSAQGYPFLVIDKKCKSVAGSTRFFQCRFAPQNIKHRLYMVWQGFSKNRVKSSLQVIAP